MVDKTEEGESCWKDIDELMGEYLVYTAMANDYVYGGYCAQWMVQIFADTTHLFIDIVYIRNNEIPGLFNIVAPCQELSCYVPVFRVFVNNKQDTTAIAKVISQVFNHINENDKTFDDGSKIEQIMVDFSDAEDAGLRKALGEDFVNRVLRGCDFHYKQSLVSETTPQQELFLSLAKRIPDATQEEVFEIFSVLKGEKPVASIVDFLPENQREASVLVRNDKWTGARHWVDWWLRENHLKKLCKAFRDTPEEVWENSQATNNPVESINRTSKTVHLCSLKEALQHVYLEYRRTAFLLLATWDGRSVTYRKTKNNRKRKRPANSMGSAQNPPDKKKNLKKKKEGGI